MILICGLPRSGNHLIREHIMRAIRARRPYVTTEVVVFHGERLMRTEDMLGVTHFVIPVRNPVFRRRSLATKGGFEHPEQRCVDNIIAMASGTPVKLVSYEALIAEPKLVGDDLLDWLGLPRVDWPDTRDSERPERGAIFNGNEKYA